MDTPKEVYVKCKYSSGLFIDQYLVSFNGSEQSYPLTGRFFVHDSALVKRDKDSVFVKATLLKKFENDSVVAIKNNEQGGIFSIVPNEDIWD